MSNKPSPACTTQHLGSTVQHNHFSKFSSPCIPIAPCSQKSIKHSLIFAWRSNLC